jgi:alpha-L-fucosidase
MLTTLALILFAQARKDAAFGMGPPASREIVAAAAEAAKVPTASGPFEPTWDSIRKNYKVPQWFLEGKFGLFMHWGVYAVPAYHNEWYQKHIKEHEPCEVDLSRPLS